MNREAMKHQILEALTKKLGDGFPISIQKVFKPNRELEGLLIMGEGEIISPTIYLESSYSGSGSPISLQNAMKSTSSTALLAASRKRRP